MGDMMKKLNRDGFTVIELLLSFLFAFVVAFAMYGLIFNYRVRLNEESIKNQLRDYTNQVTLAIQNDITERVLKDIDYCTFDDGTIIDRCLILHFNDGEMKKLSVEAGTKEYDGQIYDINYIRYGGIIYESPDAILLDYRVNYMLYTTFESEELEDENVKVFKISIPIYHNDLEEDYGISIVAVAFDYEGGSLGNDICSSNNSELPDNTIVSYDGTLGFWQYATRIKTVTFSDKINLPNDRVKTWLDMSVNGDNKVIAYVTANGNDSSYYDLYIQGEGGVVANPDSSEFFRNFTNLDAIYGGEYFNTSYVCDMSSMFNNAGSNSNVFTLDLAHFDTSNVTDMNYMFAYTGKNSNNFKLDLSSFNTANVTDMSGMFLQTGKDAINFSLNLGNNFNTSNVENFSNMFNQIGFSDEDFTLELGSKFNTNNGKNMEYMFYQAGYSSSNFTLNVNSFNTGNVTNMEAMFYQTGYSSQKFKRLNLPNSFNTSSVTNMSKMFYQMAYNSEDFILDLGDNFDTSSVIDISDMFNGIAYNSRRDFVLALGDKWNTRSVKNMERAFYNIGYCDDVKTVGYNFYINDVVNMRNTFHNNKMNIIYFYGSFKSDVDLTGIFSYDTLIESAKTTVYVCSEKDKKLLDANKNNDNVTINVDSNVCIFHE